MFSVPIAIATAAVQGVVVLIGLVGAVFHHATPPPTHEPAPVESVPPEPRQ